MRPALIARLRTIKKPVTGGTGVAVTITTQLDDHRIIQRSSSTGGGQSKGQGSASLALSFTGTQPIYARRRSASDGTTIVQSAWLANAAAVTGTVTLSGIDAVAINADGTTPATTADGWAYIDIATSSAGPWTNGTSRVAVGRVIGVSGQSLAVRMFNKQVASDTIASTGATISPYTSLIGAFTGTPNNPTTVSTGNIAAMAWDVPNDSGPLNSAYAAELGRRSNGLFGVPTALIGYAQGSQAISSFFSGGANGPPLATALARGGGAWEAFIWYQGHSDGPAPTKGYRDALVNLMTQIQGLNAYGGTVTKYVGSIPNINSSSWGTAYQRNNVRAAHALYASDSSNHAVHVQVEGILQVDGVHQNNAGAVVLAQNFARAMRVEAGLTNGNNGPALVSATRVGAVITAVFSDVGQTNLVLTGTPTDKVYVFPKGRVAQLGTSNNLFPVSSVAVVDKTHLTITLANDPGDGHILDLYLYWPQNVTSTPTTNQIRDNTDDGDGIAVGRTVMPNQVPLTIAAPVPASTINAPPSGFVKNTSPLQMTNGSTAVTFGSQEETGFGQTASGGWANASTEFWANLTLEFSFTAPTTAPTATACLITPAQGHYVLLGTNMKLSSENGNGSTTLVGGHRYRIAYVYGPNGNQVYLKDITAGTAVTREVNSTTPFTTSTTIAQFAMRQYPGQTPYQVTAAGATVDEVVMFYGSKYTGATPTLSSAPYTGTETDIYALWHLDGDLTEVVAS